MQDPNPEDPADRFSLVAGGPFHAALRRIGLIGADQLPKRSAAVYLALAAWLLPATLAAAEALVRGRSEGWGYFTDLTVHTRYLVAILVMVATERYADGRISLLTRHFRDARLLSDAALPQFSTAVRTADRRSSSALAETLIAAAALGWPDMGAALSVTLSGSSWEGTLVGDRAALSWAGEAARLVSTPLLRFLFLRWFWRFCVWAALLFRISRLPLQLAPMHPDRSAGLGFLSIYPSIFSGFVFALSAVISSAFLKDLGLERREPETVWVALAAWVAASLVLFLGPLLVFVRPLYLARERAVMEYGSLASRHHLAFHHKWITGTTDPARLMESSDASAASDLNASVDAVREMRLMPIDLAALIQLLVATGVPLLAVVAMEIPLVDLAKLILGAIFA